MRYPLPVLVFHVREIKVQISVVFIIRGQSISYVSLIIICARITNRFFSIFFQDTSKDYIFVYVKTSEYVHNILLFEPFEFIFLLEQMNGPAF